VTHEDSLDDDLRDLLASEKGAEGAPVDVRGRLAARLAVSLASGAAVRPRAHAGPPAWRSAHFVAVGAAFVVGVASGAAAVVMTRADRRPPVTVAPAPEDFASGAPTSLSPSAVPPPASVEAPAAPTQRPSSVASSPRPAASGSSLALEQAILDTARIALGREDGAAALAACDSHARRFPHGQLGEEREAIAIQALVLLHREADARARADRFARAYPTSALLGAVRDALVGGP